MSTELSELQQTILAAASKHPDCRVSIDGSLSGYGILAGTQVLAEDISEFNIYSWREALQDLVDAGLLRLGRPSKTSETFYLTPPGKEAGFVTRPHKTAGETRSKSIPGASLPFNVFLGHNSKDKPAVKELKKRLVSQDLIVWYDEDELRPGIPWQPLLEEGIKSSASVAVLVGKDGIGPWENEEMQAALQLAVRDKRPLIPVLLPGAPTQPELPMFLLNRTWVDLRGGYSADGLAKLVWGITGNKSDN
jgi:hypothetical protein